MYPINRRLWGFLENLIRVSDDATQLKNASWAARVLDQGYYITDVQMDHARRLGYTDCPKKQESITATVN
jgi:hypothetical protein